MARTACFGKYLWQPSPPPISLKGSVPRRSNRTKPALSYSATTQLGFVFSNTLLALKYRGHYRWHSTAEPEPPSPLAVTIFIQHKDTQDFHSCVCFKTKLHNTVAAKRSQNRGRRIGRKHSGTIQPFYNMGLQRSRQKSEKACSSKASNLFWQHQVTKIF